VNELLRELIESMTGKNLREKKTAALAILATAHPTNLGAFIRF